FFVYFLNIFDNLYFISNIYMSSRKLKHENSWHEFWIKVDQRPELEQVISGCVNDHCVLRKRYVLKGHTKDQDLKRIDKTIKLTKVGEKYHVILGIHMHHYSGFIFEFFEFCIDL